MYAKHVTWRQQESACGFGFKFAVLIIGVRIRDFHGAWLTTHNREDLRTFANGFGVFDSIWRQNQAAHNVTRKVRLNRRSILEVLGGLPSDFAFGVGTPSALWQGAEVCFALIRHNSCIGYTNRNKLDTSETRR